MWNFLEKAVQDFTEIVAPITNTNQLYLAISQGRTGDAKYLIDMNSSEFNIHGLMDNGQGAIHLACRFNSKEVLDLLTTKGVSIHLPDSQGCSPLHIACKYGHVDMCKYLMELGAKVLVRNKAGQTAYDIAESHLVRQYLLPFTFKAEAELQQTQQGASYVYANPFAANTRDPSKSTEPPPAPPTAQKLDYSGGNPYAGATHGTLHHPVYAAYSNPFAAPLTPAPVAPAVHAPPAALAEPQVPLPPPVHAPVMASAPVHAPVMASAPIQTAHIHPPHPSVPIHTFPAAASPALGLGSVGAPAPAVPPAPAPAWTGSTPAVSYGLPSRPVFISHSPLKAQEPTNSHAAPIAEHASEASVPTAGGNSRPTAVPALAQRTAPAQANTLYSLPPAQPQATTNVAGTISEPRRRFMPDGFHSSSNDPELQKRYGHNIEAKNVAPPPIFGATAPMMQAPPAVHAPLPYGYATAVPSYSSAAAPPAMNSTLHGSSGSLTSAAGGYGLVPSASVPMLPHSASSTAYQTYAPPVTHQVASHGVPSAPAVAPAVTAASLQTGAPVHVSAHVSAHVPVQVHVPVPVIASRPVVVPSAAPVAQAEEVVEIDLSASSSSIM